MPKQDNVTDEQIANIANAFEDATQRALSAIKRIENGYAGEIPNYLEYVARLNSTASTCIELSNKLIFTSKMAAMRMAADTLKSKR